MNNFSLIVLFLVSLIFFGILYANSKYDLADPTTGVFCFFTVSLFFAVMGNQSWDNEITIGFLIMMVFLFLSIIAGGFLGSRVRIRKTSEKRLIEVKTINRLDIPSYKKKIIIGLSVIFTVLYVYDIVQSGHSLGASGLLTITAVRASKEVSGNFIVRQGIKVIMAAAYVNSFVFINNALSKNFKKIDFVYIIPTICGIVCSIFTGVRTEIFRLVFAIIVFYCVLNNERLKWVRTNKTFKAIVRKSVVPLSVVLLLFFNLRNIIKVSKLSENSAYGLLQYLEFYIGSSWLVLNNKFNMGALFQRSGWFGEATFSQFWSDIKGFGLIDMIENGSDGVNFVLVDANNHVYGNVDTMFGSPLCDFGVIGTMVFSFLLFYMLERFYKKNIKNTYSSYHRNKKLVIYAFLYYIVGLSFYSNIVNYFLSLYFILTLIFIYLIYYFYFKFRIRGVKS